MAREIPAIRILPMSDKIPGFRGRSIEDVQKRCFLTSLPARNGRYRYRSTGLNAEPGTMVLFQFRARIIASGVFLHDEKFEKPNGGSRRRDVLRSPILPHVRSIGRTRQCEKSGRVSAPSAM